MDDSGEEGRRGEGVDSLLLYSLDKASAFNYSVTDENARSQVVREGKALV